VVEVEADRKKFCLCVKRRRRKEVLKERKKLFLMLGKCASSRGLWTHTLVASNHRRLMQAGEEDVPDISVVSTSSNQ
jgi:hypothetical protein